MRALLYSAIRLSATAVFLIGVTSWASAQTYVVQDLGNPTADTGMTWPMDMDSSGQVYLAGFDPTSPDPDHHRFFRYDGAGHHELPLFNPTRYRTALMAGNRWNQAVGNVLERNVSLSQRPILWKGDQVEMLPTDGLAGEAYGINDAGIAIGRVYTSSSSSGPSYPVIWTNGTLSYLPTEGASAYTYAINSSGTIVGMTVAAGSMQYEVTVWEGGVMKLLGIPGGARAVSSDGRVAGMAQGSTELLLFVWKDGSYRTFPIHPQDRTMTPITMSVNASGTVVAFLEDDDWSGQPVHLSALWRDGVQYDINDLIDPVSSGWHIQAVSKIGDDGRIIARGYNPAFGFPTRALILNPVPEPASLAVLGLGLAAVARRRRTRAK